MATTITTRDVESAAGTMADRFADMVAQELPGYHVTEIRLAPGAAERAEVTVVETENYIIIHTKK